MALYTNHKKKKNLKSQQQQKLSKDRSLQASVGVHPPFPISLGGKILSGFSL